MINPQFTHAEAKFIQDCIACRLASICDAIEDSISAEEMSQFFAQLDQGTDLANRLMVLRAIDTRERNSAQ